MEKKIMYSKYAPGNQFLWLHTKNNKLVLEAYNNSKWELLNELAVEKNVEPASIEVPKVTEDCTKKELINIIKKMREVLVEVGLIKD